MNVRIESITVGPLEVNCYLVIAGEGPDALLVDPGDDAVRIRKRIADLGLSVKAVLLTHGHMDHWAALPDLQANLDVPVYLHRDDHPLLGHQINRDLAAMAGWKWSEPAVKALPVGPVSIAGFEFEVTATPGHSPGSVVIRFGDRLLTGDTLFAGGIGRSDLPGGDGQVLFCSLSILKQLPPATRIYPGHGEESDLAREARFNPFW